MPLFSMKPHQTTLYDDQYKTAWRLEDARSLAQSFTTAQTSLGGFLKPTFCQSRLPKILPDCWDAGFLKQGMGLATSNQKKLSANIYWVSGWKQLSLSYHRKHFALDPVVVTTKVESCYASPSRSFQAMPCLLLAPPIHE